MNNRFKHLWLSVRVIPGTFILDAIRDAIELSRVLNCGIELSFNDRPLKIPANCADSELDNILNEFRGGPFSHENIKTGEKE